MFSESDKQKEIVDKREGAIQEQEWFPALVYHIEVLRLQPECGAEGYQRLRQLLECNKIDADYMELVLLAFGLKEDQDNEYFGLDLPDISILSYILAEYYYVLEPETEPVMLYQFIQGIRRFYNKNDKIYMLASIIAFNATADCGNYRNIRFLEDLNVNAIRAYEEEYPILYVEFYFYLATTVGDIITPWVNYQVFFERSLKISQKYIGRSDYKTLFIEALYASYLLDDGNANRAYFHAESVISLIWDKESLVWQYVMAGSVLLDKLLDEGDLNRVMRLLQELEVLHEEVKSDEDMYQLTGFRMKTSYVRYYELKGNIKMCEVYALQAYRIVEDHGMEGGPELLATYNLASVYYFMGRLDEAGELLDKADAIVQKYKIIGAPIIARLAELTILVKSPQEGYGRLKLRAVINKMRPKNYSLEYLYNILDIHIERLEQYNFLDPLTKFFVGIIINPLEVYINQKFPDNMVLKIRFYRLKILLAYRRKNKKQLKDYLLQAFTIAESVDDVAAAHDQYASVFQNSFYYGAKLFTENETEIIIQKIISGMIYRYSSIAELEDEDIILKALTTNVFLMKFIVFLDEYNKISISLKELLEVITNVQGMYLDLLKDKKIKRQKETKDSELYRELDAFEKRIIHYDLDQYFREITHEDYTKLKQQKRDLELQLQDNQVKYRWRSIDEIFVNLPVSSVSLVFVMYEGVFGEVLHLLQMRYALFCCRKTREGNVSVRRVKRVNAYCVRTALFFLNNGLQGSRESALNNRILQMGLTKLQKYFIDPLKLEQEETPEDIYIIPDFDIHLIPFSCLKADKGERLLDKSNLIFIDSLLRAKRQNSITENNALVIGNPEFLVDRTIPDSAVKPELSDLMPLPISKLEAAMIAEQFNTRPVLRQAATKKMLLNSSASIIHIATHGTCLADELDQTLSKLPSLRRSMLFFTGAKDWLLTGTVSEQYENGIMTAEEIYMSEGLKPELVVLSSCFGALGVQSAGSERIGMTTAFKAIGTRTIIGNQWATDDLAGTVLMEKFYKLLNNMSPARALRMAQIYVSNVTISDLRDNQWFDETRLRRVGAVAGDLEELQKKEDGYKPFEHLGYWSGYVIEY